ncbi:MAG: nuclear transport factor 2 family protein [Sphingomonadales bacterium]|nr:nuclear transport factor 2 family protein [Sphingomonadales bacterium]
MTVGAGCLAALPSGPAQAQADSNARRAAIDARVARLESIKAIERLQNAYGYYQDRFFFAEVETLFARRGASVQWGDQLWIGPKAVRSFWLDYWQPVIAGGSAGPVAGKLLDLPQWQGVITIGADGRTATGRFNTIGRYAVYREKEYWVSGFFQNRYVREDGVWKIAALKFCPNWSAKYTDGWQDVTAAGALAWLPAAPRKASPTRAATTSERCPKPFPANGAMPLDFADPLVGDQK